MARKRRKVGPAGILLRSVGISSFEARVSKHSDDRRGYEPQIRTDSWLVLGGLMEEPVRDVRAVEISMYMDEDMEPGPLRPLPVGSIIKVRPEISIVVSFPQFEFDRIWSLALSGHLKYAHLVFSEPYRNKAHVYDISFSMRPEE